MKKSLSRTNTITRKAEVWRPPLFTTPDSAWASLSATARRFRDLQAGSIWRDLKVVRPQVKGSFVDVGCGAQPYRGLISAEARYLGIDTIDAKEHFGYEVPDTQYYSGDRWPVLDGSAAFVLCTETLEHAVAPEELLSEAARCLSPGGTLMLTVPFAARWHFIPWD